MEQTALKYEKVASALRRRIVGGEFAPGDRLPGRASLAAEHGVGYSTLQQAVATLERDGFVSCRDRSATRVAVRPPHLHHVALVFPVPARSSGFFRAIEEAGRRVGAAEGVLFSSYVIGAGAGVDMRRLGEDLSRCRLRGAVLAWPGAADGDAPAWNGLPRVQIADRGRPDCPAVCPEHGCFTRRAIDALRGRGRRRIAHLAMDAPHVDPDEFERGLAGHGIEVRRHWVQYVPNGETVRSAGRIVELLVRLPEHDRPDGLIIHDDNLFEPAVGGLLTARVGVPDDLDVVALANFPSRSRSPLPVSRLGFDCEAMLRRCLQVIERQACGERVPLRQVLDVVSEDEVAPTIPEGT